jgi:hypothetical protein
MSREFSASAFEDLFSIAQALSTRETPVTMCSYTSKEQQVYSKESARSGFWQRAAGEGKRVPARSREERHQRQVLPCDEHLM